MKKKLYNNTTPNICSRDYSYMNHYCFVRNAYANINKIHLEGSFNFLNKKYIYICFVF